MHDAASPLPLLRALGLASESLPVYPPGLLMEHYALQVLCSLRKAPSLFPRFWRDGVSKVQEIGD